MRLLTALMLISSVAFSQTFTAKYMVVREISVDSIVNVESKFYETPTFVDVKPKRVKISNSVVELDLFGEALLDKRTIVYRNKFGELFVIKRSKKGLLILGDKEYVLTNRLK